MSNPNEIEQLLADLERLQNLEEQLAALKDKIREDLHAADENS